MRKLFVTAALVFVITPLSSAFAISCDNPINNYDRTYCSALEMIQLDEELNGQYKKTTHVLNAEQKSLVKKAQIQWIRERDAQCFSGRSIAVGCVNQKMKNRIEILKKIERECKAAGCTQQTLSQVE